MNATITKIRESNTQFLTVFSVFKVVDDKTKTEASSFLGQIKTRLNRMEQLRLEVVGPLNAQVRKMNNMFKAESEPLEQAELNLKKQVGSYIAQEERKAQEEAERLRKEQEEAERKAQEEAERLRKEAEEAKTKKAKKELEKQAEEAQERAREAAIDMPEVKAPPTSVRTEHGLTTARKVWKWELEKEELVRKTHPELFVLDTKAVNKLISGGTRQIAGLRIYQDIEVAVRA